MFNLNSAATIEQKLKQKRLCLLYVQEVLSIFI